LILSESYPSSPQNGVLILSESHHLFPLNGVLINSGFFLLLSSFFFVFCCRNCRKDFLPEERKTSQILEKNYVTYLEMIFIFFRMME
jgi:hypothetical protein